MRCHDHATAHAIGSHRYLWAVVEAANHLTFRTLLKLIGRQVQACLNERMIEHAVFFATGHKGKAGQIGEHRSGAVLAIKPQQGVFLWELICRQIATNGRERFPQFLSVSPVATVAKTAEPLIAVRLRNRCARPDDFPTFAPFVARGTDLIQSAEGLRQVSACGKARWRAASRVPSMSNTIHVFPTRSTRLPVCLSGVSGRLEQIVEKERPQGFDWGLRQRR